MAHSHSGRRRFGVTRTVLAAVAVAAVAAAAASAGDAGGTGRLDADSFNVAALLGRWDKDRLREFSRQVNTLPDSAVCLALWYAAGAPRHIDTSSFFVAAISSPSPVVRRQTADILVSLNSPDAVRILHHFLVSENDVETVRHVTTAMGRQKTGPAVRGLMALMLLPGADQKIIAAATAELRRITKTNVPATAAAWQDWWMDNSHVYEN